MEIITEFLAGIVGDAFEKCGYDRSMGRVTMSDRLDLCQFQCNGAFEGAKRYKKAPFMIADEVVAAMDKSLFSKAEAVRPGFINLTLSDSELLKFACGAAGEVPAVNAGETIVIDYGGPNVAKPLHIGHLRSAVIGESIKRILKACGARVIGDIHLGDWGLQIGLIISELKHRHPDWRCFAPDFDENSDTFPDITLEDLSEIYPFASKKSKEDDGFKREALKATADLQKGQAGYMAVWKKIMAVSVPDLKQIYDRLNVSFDCWYGESDAEKYVDKLMDTLHEKGLVRESDGALVVDVVKDDDTAEIPPVIVKKSDGSNIYATTDLATIIQRQRDFSPNKLIYITDSRQSLHFEQVFRCARLAQLIPDDTSLEFLGFGTVNGPDGKPFKTRDGGTMRLEELLNMASAAALEKLNESDRTDDEANDEQRADKAEKIGIAAIKFGDLINQKSKDYIFDMSKFLSFEGKTGPYILYTVTRINSILKRLNVPYESDIKPSEIYSDIERELYLKIALSSETVVKAAADRAPNVICENLYQTAALFSRFYHDNRIIDEPNAAKRQNWTALIITVRKVLMLYLDLLGIEAVDSM